MCDCRKKKVVVTPVIIEELPKQITQEEIDWYNNIDTIEPIKPKEDE